MSLSHDYRWLGSSIKQALADDAASAAADSKLGSEVRSWKQIQFENATNKNQTKTTVEKLAAAAAAAAAAEGGELADPSSPPPPQASAPGSAADNGSTLIVDERDPIYRIAHLVDPSSFFPPDKSRPFTGVHLVAMKANGDWSAIQKRAALIAETRKAQLQHAYHHEPAVTVGHLTTAQQKAAQRRQLRDDRRRMRAQEREAKQQARIKLQAKSSMLLSPPTTPSESSPDTTSSDEEAAPKQQQSQSASKLKGGGRAGAKAGGSVTSAAAAAAAAGADASSSSSSDDGPPPDAEEIAMRMERIAWRRTRDIIGRTLNRLHEKAGTGLATKMTPASQLLGLPSGSPHGGRGHTRAGSIMNSNDVRVQGVYDSATADVAQIKSKEEELKLKAESKAKSRAAQELAQREAAQRKEDQKEHFRVKVNPAKLYGNHRKSKPAVHTATHVRSAQEAAKFARQSQKRLLAEPMRERAVFDRSTNPIAEESGSFSPASPSSRTSSPSRRERTLAESQSVAQLLSFSGGGGDREMARSDSAPLLEFAGHAIRAPSPSRWKKQQQTLGSSASATSFSSAAYPAAASTASISGIVGGSISALASELPLGSTISSALSMVAAAGPTAFAAGIPGTPLLMGRRPRGGRVPEGRAGGAGESGRDSGSDGESSNNTFLTSLPHAHGPGSGAPFSVPEYAASGPTPLPAMQHYAPGSALSMRRAVSNNVLSPLTPSPAVAAAAAGTTVHHLRDSPAAASAATAAQHLPTILKPISSMVRSHTSDPLGQLSTSLVVAGPSPVAQSSIMRKLAANLAAADAEMKEILTPEQLLKRRTAEQALLNDDPFSFLRATATNVAHTPRLSYALKRGEKSDLASKIMMSFSHADMQNISDEIVANGGEMTKSDFIRITRRKRDPLDRDYRAETEALSEMFDEIDVNGDRALSFLEFTSYLVELAHNQFSSGGGSGTGAGVVGGPQGLGGDDKSLSINHYQSVEGDTILCTNEDDIEYAAIKYIEPLDAYVATEKDQVRFKILSGKTLRMTKLVRGHKAPILATEYLPHHQLLCTSSADKTLKFWSCDWDRDGKQRVAEEADAAAEQAQTTHKNVVAHSPLANSHGMGNSSKGRQASAAAHAAAAVATAAINASMGGGPGLSGHRVRRSVRKSPLVPTYAEIASWSTPLPQFHLCWNKTRLCSSDGTGRIIVWNVDSGDTRASYCGHESKVHAMLAIPDMLASGAEDTTVRLWDNTHGVCVATLKKHQRPVRSLCYNSPFSLLASAGDDDFLRLWDVNSHKHVSSFFFDAGWFKTLAGQDSDSIVGMECLDNELIVGSRRGTFRVFDVRMMRQIQVMHLPDVESEDVLTAVEGDDPSRARRKKLLGSGAGGLLGSGVGVDDVGDDMELNIERLRRRAKIQLNSFCVFRDEALIEEHRRKQKEAQRERDEERARAMEAALLTTGSTAGVAEAYPDVPVELAMDPRCQLIVGASGRYLHRFGKGGSLSRHMSHDDPLLFAEFNPNSLTIFTVSSKAVKIWCALTGRLTTEYTDLLERDNFSGAALLITSACLDQRKRKFILGDNQGNIYIFNYNTGALMHKLSNTVSSSQPSTTNSVRLTAALAAASGGAKVESLSTDILNLHCLLNVSYQGATEDGKAGQSSSPNISIHFLHSLGNFMHIHVDDPDHLPNQDGAAPSADKAAAAATGGVAKRDQKAAAAGAHTQAMVPSRTVLHSLSAHKAEISCIAISDKFALIFSSSADCSVVAYPWHLRGSATQRIVPAEALDAIAVANGFPSSLSALRTPILSVVVLHPYKMLACSDSLGHIFFYYFNRDAHRLIGIIRNSKRLDNLKEEARKQAQEISALAAEAAQSDAARNAKDAALKRAIKRREGAVASLHAGSEHALIGTAPEKLAGASGAASASSTAPAPTAGASIQDGGVDYPPVLSMVFDSVRNVLYTSDDMGQLKGWALNTVLFDIHAAEYRKRRWNEFSHESDKAAAAALAAGPQPAVRQPHGWFKNDEHELLSEAEVAHLFHWRATLTTPGIVTRTFQLKPCFEVQAHNGACNGVQLVEADAGLRAMGPGGEPIKGEVVDLGSAAATAAPSRTRSRVHSPRGNDGVGASAKASKAVSSRGSTLASPQATLRRSSLAPPSVGASKAVSTSHSRRGSKDSEDGAVQIDISAESRAQDLAAATAKAAAAMQADKDKPGPTNRELQLAEEAKLRAWEQEEWDQESESDPEDTAPPGAAAAPAASGSTKSPIGDGGRSRAAEHESEALRSLRDMPDNPRGQGRRVSIATEMQQQRRASMSKGRSPEASSRRSSSPSRLVISSALEDADASAASTAQKVAAATAQKASGQCLLSFGSDGCVHLFSVATRKKLGTLQQGFTVRNCQTTPPEWRFFYPIRARQKLDERQLSATIAAVEISEAAARDREAHGITVGHLLQDRTSHSNLDKLGQPRLRSGMHTPLQVLSIKKLPSMAGSAASGNTHAPGTPAEEKDNSTLSRSVGPHKSADSLLHPSSGGGDDPEAEAERAEKARLNSEFAALESSIQKALRKEKRKLLRSANSKRSLPAADPLSEAQQQEQMKLKAIVHSKSMSALTPSIYASSAAQIAGGAASNASFSLASPSGLSSSASAASLLSVPGSLPGVGVGPRARTPSKQFTSIDHSATWVDYDGTQRTYDDPLQYRFSVDSYLADVASRTKDSRQAAAAAMQQPPHFSLGSEPSSSPLSPLASPKPGRSGAAGGGRDSGSESEGGSTRGGSSRGARSTPSLLRSPTFSSSAPSASLMQGSASGAMPDDAAMAALQGATLLRQRRLQREEARRAAKAKARSEELLQATLKREAELRARMSDESRKLSPRSADMVRVRMLLSRKPAKLVEAQLESYGMSFVEAPKPRKELTPFGEMREVQEKKTNRQIIRELQLHRAQHH